MGFRVRDGAEAMINAVRKFMKNDTNRVLMPGDIANAYGSIDRLAVLKAVRKLIPCLAPLCASQFVRDGTVAVIQERGENGKKCELHNSVAKDVCHTEQRDILLDFLEQANKERPVMGLISYADDIIVSSDGDEADRVWDETTGALGEIGLEIDQSKSCYTSKAKTGCNHKTLAFKKEIVAEATEWNSTTADEQDASLAQKRLNEASEFAGHVAAVTQLHLDSRKSEALWLMTSKSIARSLDFDAKVVNSRKMKLLAETPEARTKDICEKKKLLERSLDDDGWTRMKLPTSLGGMGIRAVTSQLETTSDTRTKKTGRQAERIEKSLTRKHRGTRA